MAIPPFIMKNPITGTQETVAVDFSKHTFTRSRDGVLGPELELFVEAAWEIQLRLRCALRHGEVACSLDFWCHQPRFIGEQTWDADGLQVDLTTAPGVVWYSIPFGGVRQHTEELFHAAAHRFAVIENGVGGLALLPTTGAQGLSATPKDGRISLRLGSSALGEVSHAPEIARHTDGSWEHVCPMDGAYFQGHYHHEFSVRPYTGSWQDNQIPTLGRQRQNPLIIRELSKSHRSQANGSPADLRLMNVQPESIEVAGVKTDGNAKQLIVYETHGKEAAGAITVGGHSYPVRLAPWEIQCVKL